MQDFFPVGRKYAVVILPGLIDFKKLERKFVVFRVHLLLSSGGKLVH